MLRTTSFRPPLGRRFSHLFLLGLTDHLHLDGLRAAMVVTDAVGHKLSGRQGLETLDFDIGIVYKKFGRAVIIRQEADNVVLGCLHQAHIFRYGSDHIIIRVGCRALVDGVTGAVLVHLISEPSRYFNRLRELGC